MLSALLPRLFARRLATSCAALLATAALLLGQTSSALDGFDPDVDGNVFVLATQADGRLVIGGQFSNVRGTPRNNIARLNADGSLDESFNPNADGAVRAIIIQADGRMVIGGDFSKLSPNGGAEVSRGRIARLNTNGAVDAGFALTIRGQSLPGGGQLNAQVFALAQQPDGSILVGGSFDNMQPGNLTVIYTRRNLMRLSANGVLDERYEPHPNGMVLAIVPHVDNKVVIAGGFTSLWPAGDAVPSTRNRIARLNANGTVDSEFNPNANNAVAALAVQRDGKILLGGSFTTLQPIGDESPANRSRFARLNPSGTLDSEFHPTIDGNVAAIAVQPDGRILIGGSFSAISGIGPSVASRAFIARFNSDATLDTSFTPTVNGQVDAFAFQSDGKIVLGGHFTRALPRGGTTPLLRNHVARLNADGSLDTHFEIDPGGRPLVSITQTDGKIVIGGTFTNVGGATHRYLARLNADGTVDSTYAPALNGPVYTMAYDAASNKVLIGGEFTTIGGESRNHIARLNPSGTIDSEFNPNIDGRVNVLTLESGGRILVGGTFTTVFPIGSTTTTARSNMLRLDANGRLDTAFDPSPNSAVTAIAVQSDGKIIIGGLFSALTPGFAANTSATTTARNFIARLNTDGTIDTAFNPTSNGQISTIVVQSDGKIIVGGSFGGFAPPGATELTVRNRIARINTDGTIDATYNPNANDNVLTAALQSDGKLLIGGSFTTLQPNPDATFILRKYAARLNTDGTVDNTFNLDIEERPGNRVDSIRIQSNGQIVIGGAFNSLQPVGTPGFQRRNFARLAANGAVDATFDPGVAGSTSAVVNGFALQPDGNVIAVGRFTDLGGAKSTNIARFRPEGTVDPDFSSTIASDGGLNAVVVRPNVAPVASQVAGLAWLNAGGTLRTAFAPTTRLSGQINAIVFDREGRLLVGGSFVNVSNTTAGNLVRFNANGTLDTSFNPNPSGEVTGIAVQADGRIVIVGSFTTVGGAIRNRMARIDDNGSLDVTYDPNASARIHAVVLDAEGRAIVGGSFTTFTPNATTTAITRNYLARINADGTVDANYDPAPNSTVNALALTSDGKLIAGGSFTSVVPNGAAEAKNRSGIARFNSDGTVDQNFHPNANGVVTSLVSLPNGQLYVGGSFTTFQPNETGTVHTRNYLARLNSDGAVDQSFNPNPNNVVTTLALQNDGSLLVGGIFGSLQPNATGAVITRNRLARVSATGAVDLVFNPDVNGSVSVVTARPDGTVLIGGSFTALQLNGSIVVGGEFAAIGGVDARNLAMLNENGSVNATFRPRPDGAVNALLAQPDGKVIVGGAFTNIAGIARAAIARFNSDGSLDTSFSPTTAPAVVTALALQPDGKVVVGGSAGGVVRLNANGSTDATFTAVSTDVTGSQSPAIRGLAVQADGKVLALSRTLVRYNADGTIDSTGPAVSPDGGLRALALQADGGILLAGTGTITVTGTGAGARQYLARLTPAGGLDPAFNPAPNAAVTALAIQPDGRVLLGGSFTRVAGQSRVALARVAPSSPAVQMIGVSANRTTVMWNRSGSTGELSAVTFEQSSDRSTWTPLGSAVRVAGSANWQLTGLNLPASGVFYIRALGIAPTTAGTSAGLYEMVREFNYASVGAGTAVSVPATAASPVMAFDAFTGIGSRATLSIVAGEGTVEILAATADPATTGTSRLVNLSTRGRVTAENPLLLGFAIAGNEPRRVLLRAVGPGLAGFGVTDALTATRLEIYDTTGRVLSSVDGWSGANLAQVFAETGAFPLAVGSADSATVLTLQPGTYTMQVIDSRGRGGVALAEIYDAGTGSGSRLVNVSSRGAAGSGSAALISGFVISGPAAQRVLLRGVGPGLTRFGATGVVADPSVTLFDGAGLALGSNDNWVSSVTHVSSAAAGSGAFALDPGSKDAAVLATLPAGAYTTQVSAGSTGTALLEIYEVR